MVTEPTAYLDTAGEPIALAPGQVWIILMDRSRKVTIDKPAQAGA